MSATARYRTRCSRRSDSYTFWADLEKLWADAIKYLKELEEYDRREAKRYGTPTRAEVEKERQLRDYLSKV